MSPYINHIQETVPKLVSKLSCNYTKEQRLEFLSVIHRHLSNAVHWAGHEVSGVNLGGNGDEVEPWALAGHVSVLMN